MGHKKNIYLYKNHLFCHIYRISLSTLGILMDMLTQIIGKVVVDDLNTLACTCKIYMDKYFTSDQ